MRRPAAYLAGTFGTVCFAALLGHSTALAGKVEDEQVAHQATAPRAPKHLANAAASPEVTAAAAAPSSVTLLQPTTTAPRRSKPKASLALGPYYVDFRARTAASYGHAFVWYGKTSEKMVEVAGLHPRGDELPYILGHLTWVPADTGASYGDLDEEYLTASYRVYLTEPEAKRVFAYIKEIQSTSKFWNAQTNNCTSFIGKIASFMGLKTPFHLIFPEQYVKNLKEMNGGRQTAMLDPAQ